MDCQDWTDVKVGRPKHKAPPPPKASSSVVMNHVLETEELPVPKKSLSHESRKELVQKRVALEMNQTQLNNACSFPPNTIRDIENGKLCPNPTQLTILNRVLKASLKYS